ncbi:malate synthase A [Burkholderia sp. Leaf177]|uniref:malate synthase A n=1 Tax=Burkholderia sp. Leaf177 TaxID=1736287 RepID=UPI0009E7D3A1|nr:malate synthase A [Burkholderia sp. Leaf177]
MVPSTYASRSVRIDAADPFADVLSEEALAFIAALDREFTARRREVLQARQNSSRQRQDGNRFGFLPITANIRNDPAWRVPSAPSDLIDRRVEIASTADSRKVVINALNAGAQVWVADLEDAMSPTWQNAMVSQRNLKDAVAGTISYLDPHGKLYELENNATAIVVRPRGWHLPEDHLLVDGHAASASLVDFGLYFFHCASKQLEHGSGPYFYLPKLENHLDARLWNDVFEFAEDWAGMPHGTIRATVIIEHIGAAYEMEEILHVLGPHAAGLTAGRWDYFFSIAKEFRNREDCVLPDRSDLTMSLPFMRAYTELLIRTCHKRGTHALGGVATQIPDRSDVDARAQAINVVRRDKEHEAAQGFDGTWVVHPDFVKVCHDAFDPVLDRRPNQIGRMHAGAPISAADLMPASPIGGHITEQGLRSNIAISIRYLEAWLRGRGSVRLFGLMEGAATVEISRSQIWQWLQHGARLQDGRLISHDVVRALMAEEISRYCESSDGTLAESDLDNAKALFEEVAMGKAFPDFLTIPGYRRLNGMHEERSPRMNSARQTTSALTCSSGMFTNLQLKPRVAFSFGFMGWSAWLMEHAVSHAALVRDHLTGFVPIGLSIEYLGPFSFLDCETMDVVTRVSTWNPHGFHTLQDIDVLLSTKHGNQVARITMQEVCVRIESPQTLAAAPGRLPSGLAPMFLDSPADIHERPTLMNRGTPQVPEDAERIIEYRHDFIVHRHACEVADQWYSEHVCDYVGDSREAMVMQWLDTHPALLPGLSQRIERISIGLRRPYMLFDRGYVITTAYCVGQEIHFHHRLMTASGADAGDALEVFSCA